MVHRVFKFLNREFGGLHEAAFLLSFSTLLSQLLALVRDRLLAHNFGAGTELDVYYASFRIPDILFVTIASFVSVTVLIPILISKFQGENIKEVKKFFNQVFTLFMLVMVGSSLVLFFIFPYIVPLTAPGFSEEMQSSMVTLSRILLLSPILLGLSSLFGSVSQSLRYFLLYSLSPVFYNLGIIIGIVFLLPELGLSGLAWGVVIGAVLHMAIQLPVIIENKFFPSFTFRIDWREMWGVVRLSLPRTATLAAHQLSLMVLVAFASFMAGGSVAIFNFSFNLQSIPLALVGVSYSIAAFPALTKLFSAGDKKVFMSQMEEAIRHILFWSIPAAVTFIVLRAQIVRVILGSGGFDWQDTRITAAALALFALSVPAQSLVLLFARSYYAGGLTRKPLVLNSLCSISMIVFAFIFINFFGLADSLANSLKILFRVGDVSGAKILILPFAYSAGLIFNTILYWFYFQKDFNSFSSRIYYSLVKLSFLASRSLKAVFFSSTFCLVILLFS